VKEIIAEELDSIVYSKTTPRRYVMKIINDFAIGIDGRHVLKIVSNDTTIRLKENNFKKLSLLDPGDTTKEVMPDGDEVTVEVGVDERIYIKAVNDFEGTVKKVDLHRSEVRQIMKFVAEAEIAEENIDKLKEIKKSLIHSPKFGRKIDGEIKYLKEKFDLR